MFRNIQTNSIKFVYANKIHFVSLHKLLVLCFHPFFSVRINVECAQSWFWCIGTLVTMHVILSFLYKPKPSILFFQEEIHQQQKNGDQQINHNTFPSHILSCFPLLGLPCGGPRVRTTTTRGTRRSRWGLRRGMG